MLNRLANPESGIPARPSLLKPRWPPTVLLPFILLLSLLLSSGQPSPPQDQAGEPVLTDAQVEKLPLQHRRYLLYLYARLGKQGMAEKLARRILQESSGDKQTYLVLASMYLERRDTEKALLNGKTLVELYPNDDQAWYFLGAAHQQAGHAEEANRIFRTLKEKQFQGRLYPYQADLASAALQAGDWHRALQAYQQLLRDHALSDELRLQARAVLEGIYREHLPQLGLQEEFLWLNEGMIYRTLAEYEQHLNPSHRLFSRFSHETTQVDNAPGLLKRSHSSFDGALGLETTFSRKWSTRAWLGGAEPGILGGASATRFFGPQRELTLRYQGNERSQDGLLLESLDGRQHRFSLEGSYLFSRSWLAYTEIFAREVHIRDDSLGRGVGGNLNIEHIFQHEKPNFRAGYRTYVSTFSEKDHLSPELLSRAMPAPLPGTPDLRPAALENLVLDYLHRQGLYLRFEDHLSDFFRFYGTIGSDYAVETSSLEYYWQTGFRIYPRKSVELRLDGGYFSSATTSAQASEQWQMIAAVKLWF